MLSNILSDVNASNIPAYIVGDFNIDVLKFYINPFANEYVNCFFLNGYIQIVTKPTVAL
jgi:hypothetical protein